MRHHLVGGGGVDGLGRIVVGQSALVDGAPGGGLVVGGLDESRVGRPVGVFHKLLVACRRDDDAEIHGPGGSCQMLLLADAMEALQDSEDVVAGYDILRAECLPMVVAVLHIVVEAQLLQAVAVGECAVGDDNLQVGVAVLRAAVGLPELDHAQVVAMAEGVGGDGERLVVVIRAGVVVDAHHAVVALQVAGVGPHHLCIPDVLVVLLCQQAGGRELLEVGVPVAQRLHQCLMTLGIVLQCLALVVAHIAVFRTVDRHVGLGLHIQADALLVGLPRAAAQVVMVF